MQQNTFKKNPTHFGEGPIFFSRHWENAKTQMKRRLPNSKKL